MPILWQVLSQERVHDRASASEKRKEETLQGMGKAPEGIFMDIRYWCPYCGSRNTQMIVFEIEEDGKVINGTLRCLDCNYIINFKEISDLHKFWNDYKSSKDKYFCQTCDHYAREGIDEDNEECCSYKCWIRCNCKRCHGGEEMAKKCVGCGKDTKNALEIKVYFCETCRDKMVTQAKEGKQ